MMFCGTSTVLRCNTSRPPIRVLEVGFGVNNRHKVHVNCRPSAKPPALSPNSPVLLTSSNDGRYLLGSRSSSHESDSSPTGSSQQPLPNSPNRVGIMGGMSPLATLGFLQKLVRWSYADGGGECLPFIVCSDPLLNGGLSSAGTSSTEHPNKWSRNYSLEMNHALIVDNLQNKRAFLERSGARCIILPCHVLPAWQAEISEGCVVPFLHVGDCVAEELKAANLKPIEAGSTVRIGVLADEVGLAAQIYQKKLENQGFEVIQPDRATMEHTVIPAIESFNRKDMEGARNLLRIAIQVLLVRAVNVIILASADMSTLLPQDDPLLKKCINPMDALARATIRWAKEAREEF